MCNRLTYIDIIKGLAILLVVLGHAIQAINDDFDSSLLFRYIYSFHMPLFMAVSGFLSYKPAHRQSIYKRFYQLMIPFFCWMIVNHLLMHFTLPSFDDITNVVKYPDRGLWYLWALFFISLIYYILNVASSAIKIQQEILILLLIPTLSAFVVLLDLKLFGINFISWYIIFYTIGYYMRKYDSKVSRIYNYKILFILSILFILLGYFWMRKEAPSFWIYPYKNIFLIFYKLIAGLNGILFVFLLSKLVLGKLNNSCITLIQNIGKATLGIYVIHYLWLKLFCYFTTFVDIEYKFRLILVFLFSILFSYLCVIAIRKNYYISGVLLGELKY